MDADLSFQNILYLLIIQQLIDFSLIDCRLEDTKIFKGGDEIVDICVLITEITVARLLGSDGVVEFTYRISISRSHWVQYMRMHNI